ncbi:MAG: OmpA family protein [Patulibacter minatonensis]
MSTRPLVGGFARSRRVRSILLPFVVALATLLGAAAPASASHLQGGFFTAKITDTGRLQGTITYLEVTACPSGVGSQKSLPITVTSPTSQVVSKSVPTTATKCGAGGSTYEGSFDYPLDTTTFSSGAPDGDYTLTWTAGNRIYNIVNVTDSGNKSVRFSAKVRKVTGVATGAPFLGSEVATGVGIGELYSQNLNASDPDDVLGNGTLTYVALTGDADLAPNSNVINLTKLQANGQVEIPVSTTSGFANNSYYVYKVRVTDDQGDYAERDVLLRAVTPNRPPVINGLNTTTGYDIAAGASQTINFNATDPDAANTVKITGAALPSWVTLTQTSGNPATATLTLNPPADANTRVYRFNFDATDNDSNQVLVGSRTIEVRVAGSPETQLKSWPAARTTSTSATFTFAAADPGYTFECSLDNFATFEVCSSPKTYTGLSDGPRTFKVRANDGTKVDPSPASYSWVVDTTPPTTTFPTKPAATTNSTTANFTFATNESGGVTYECSLDGVAFAACTTPKSYTGLADGSHTLRVRATDVVGNVESPAASYTWVIDRTAPDTTIDTKPSSPSGSASATFTASSNESPVTFECKVDAGAWAACPAPITFTGLSDGSHTVQIRAVDAAGNTDPTPASYTWTIDTTAPDTSLDTHPASLTTATTATFTFSSADGTATFECKVDGGSWTACTSPLNLTGLADGSHTVDVRALDPAGNADATPESFTWTVDATAPATALDSHPAALSDSASAQFTFSSTDNTATFECRLDGGAWVTCPSPKSLTGLADGAHTFEVRAVDPAGNVDPSPKSYTWTVDTTHPATTLDTHPSAQSSVSTAAFTFSSPDPSATFECRLDGGAWGACTTPKQLTGLADGAHTFEVRAVDPAGNADPSPQSYTWNVDTVTPSSSITSKPVPHSASSTATFAFSSADTTATFECQLDGGAWVPCTSPRTYTGLTDGDHTVKVRAVDPAGNVEGTPSTYTWNVDTAKPNAPAVRQSPNASATSATFVFEREPGATLECQVDGGAWVPCDTTYTPELSDGKHTLKVRQTDAAGNVSDTAERTWTLDRKAPDAPTVLSGPSGPTTDRTVGFEFSAEPDSTIECRLDGGAWGPCTSPLRLADLGLGDHTLELRATDAAGNVSVVATEKWTVVAKADPAPAKPEGPKTAKVEISRTVAVDATKSTVGCSVKGVTINGCEVAIYAKKSDLGLAEVGTKAGNTLVRIGTGKTQTDRETGRVGVKVTLNSTGKAAAAKPGGVKVRVNIKAQPANGTEALFAHRYSKIRPATQMVVPADGLFATDSAVISAVGKRYLQSVAGGLYGAKGVSCIGHTDAQGAASYNKRLGQARAAAVCHYLSLLGVKAPKKASSVGETRPRATNMTAAGRQLNRRVELSVRYQ